MNSMAITSSLGDNCSVKMGSGIVVVVRLSAKI